MKKFHQTLFLFTVLLLLGFTARAQETGGAELPDKLFLRDGSVLKGKLMHIVQGESIWFLSSTGDTLVFKPREVERLVQDADQLSDTPFVIAKKRKPYSFREEGLYFNTMAALGLGKDLDGNTTGSAGLAFSAGYMLDRWLGIGGGVGMDLYHPERGEIVYPVFAEGRGYLSTRNRSPYYLLRLGYGMAFPDENNNIIEARGGLMVHPALGMRWGAAEDVNFVTDLGFQYQRSSFTFETFNGEVDQRMGYKRWVFRLGIVF